MIISGKKVGQGCSEAFGALSHPQTAEFMNEYLDLCRKHGMALCPQNTDYEICFLVPLRVVPVTDEVVSEINDSWVCFE